MADLDIITAAQMNVSSTLSNRPVYDLVNETDDGGVFIFSSTSSSSKQIHQGENLPDCPPTPIE